MLELTELLARPDLAARDRPLVAAKVAIADASWSRLAECATTSRTLGHPRSELEETLLQAVLFYGFPRVVSAFGVLSEAWPADTPPSGGALPPAEQAGAGAALFAAIYGDNTDDVLTMLTSHHGELHDFVLQAAYGRILTRPGLAAHRRELLAVAALAALGQRPQLVAHGRGALALGASAAEVAEAIFVALQDADAVASEMHRIAQRGR
ncbi:MAG: carboxymuconolactone decarboxylase family protein [Planctomycetota bacterium]